MSDVENGVKKYYDEIGWTQRDSELHEDKLFRAASPDFARYYAGVQARTARLFDGIGGSFLIAGCGDMPDSHVEIARKFDQVTCLDISESALAQAKEKLPDAKFTLGSILDMPFAEGTFDAIYCAHVIYHIDQAQQEQAVRNLYRMLKPGGKLVIVYVNHRNIGNRLLKLKRLFSRTAAPTPTKDATAHGLYFFAHPLSFWQRFEAVSLKAWTVLALEQELELFPKGRFRGTFYALAALVERIAPWVAARTWRYVMPVLTKRRNA